MAYQINGFCMGCGCCLEVCPTGAVENSDGKFRINQDVCVSCGCCVDNCPMGVIEESN